jgi:hypothetical protein
MKTSIVSRTMPVILSILAPLRADLSALGMEPGDLAGEFSALLAESLARIGLSPEQSRRRLAGFATHSSTLPSGSPA